MSTRAHFTNYGARAATGFASRAGGYLREGPGGINFEKLIFYGAIVLLGYGIFKAYRFGSAVASGAKKAAEAAGYGAANAFEWFYPFDTGETQYWTVQFPGGAKHAIGSRSVSKDGTFSYNSTKYRLAVDKSIVSGVNKFAIPL
jgi:hypothetical protein